MALVASCGIGGGVARLGDRGWLVHKGSSASLRVVREVWGAKNRPVPGRGLGPPWSWGQQLGFLSPGAVLGTVQKFRIVRWV